MTEEIKEILDRIKNYPEKLYCLNETEKSILLDYIANLQQLYENALKINQNENKYRTELEEKYVVLQQDLDKANDIIKKDRQFYKCRMDEYVELKKENEELNRMCELYSKSLYNAELTDYKSRCEKANKIITDFMCTEEYCNVDPVAIAENYMEIQKALNGSDEK